MSEFTTHDRPVDFELMAQQLQPIADLFDKEFSHRSDGSNTRSFDWNPEGTAEPVADYVLVVCPKSAVALSKFINRDGAVVARAVSYGFESSQGNPTWNDLIVGDRAYSFTTTVDSLSQLVDDTKDMVRIALWRTAQTPAAIKAAAELAKANLLSRDAHLRGLAAFALGKASYTRVNGIAEFIVEEGFDVPDDAIVEQRKISLGHIAVAHDQTIASGDVLYTASSNMLRLVEPSLVMEALRKAIS